MEAYQTEFCEDEFYNILETMSPFAPSGVNEIVEFCAKCKSAPCGCLKSAGNSNVKMTVVPGTLTRKR